MQTTAHSQKGFGAIAYLLSAVVLLALITGAIAVGGGDEVRQARLDETRSELFAQTQYVAAAIRNCAIENGGTGIDDFPCDSAVTPSTPGSYDINDGSCSAAPPSPQASECWGTDFFLPKDIAGLAADGNRADWQYRKDADAISIGIRLDGPISGDPQLQAIIGQTDGRFAPAEAASCDEGTRAAEGEPGDLFIYFIRVFTAGADHCALYD